MRLPVLVLLALAFPGVSLGATGQAAGKVVNPGLAGNSSSTVVTATGSTSARPLKDRFADVINAKDYGAKGDGSTNDTAVINALLAAALDGGTVYLPPGTYVLGAGSTALVINGKASIVGAGIGKTTLRYTGSGAAIKVNDGTVTNREHHGWTISGLTVDGAGSGAVGISYGQTAVSPNSAGGLTRDVEVKGFTTAGLDLVAAQLAHFDNVWATGNTGAIGVRILGTGMENDIDTFSRCKIRNNRIGVYATQYDTISFNHVDVEGNTEEAYSFYAANDSAARTNLFILGGWIENNNTSRDPATNPVQIKFDGNTGNSTGFKATKIWGVRFTGRGTANGEIHVRFWRGNYSFLDNELENPQTSCLSAFASSLVTIHGRSSVKGYGPETFFSGTSLPTSVHLSWETAGDALGTEVFPFSWGIWMNTGRGGAVPLERALSIVAGNDSEGAAARPLVVIGSGGAGIAKHLSATKTWDPASIANGGGMTSTTVTVTGAVVGDTVAVGFSNAVPAGALLVGAVTSADTVTVSLVNFSATNPLDLASGTLRADAWRH